MHGLIHRFTACRQAPFWVLLFTLHAMWLAVAQAVETTQFGPDRYGVVYTESNTDLQVKVLGGYVSVYRTWAQGAWQFNRHWSNLAFSSEGDSPKTIRIGQSDYERQPLNNGYHWVHRQDKALSVVKTATGWQWQNRQGDTKSYTVAGVLTHYRNLQGHQVRFVRNSVGDIQQVLDPKGQPVLTFTYQAGRLQQVEDRHQRRVVYTWDNGDLTRVTDVRGHDWHYAYATYRDQTVLSQKTNPENDIVTITHKVVAGQSVQYCTPVPGTWVIETYRDPITGEARYRQVYRPNSQVKPVCTQQLAPAMVVLDAVKWADGEGVDYRYNYNAVTGEYAHREQYSDGRVMERFYGTDGRINQESRSGTLTQQRLRGQGRDVIVDANGQATIYHYDAYRNITQITWPDGAVERFAYHPRWDFVTWHEDRRGKITRRDYNEAGDLQWLREGVDTPLERVTEFVYDENRLVKTVIHHGDDVTPRSVWGFRWDDDGNLTQRIDPLGHTQTYDTFDALGQANVLIDANGHRWETHYDAQGNLEKHITPLMHTWRWTYDKAHRLIKHTDATGSVTQWGHDLRGFVTKETNALNEVRHWVRRFDGQIRRHEDGEKRVVERQYDTLGRLQRIEDGEGNVTLYDYPAVAREPVDAPERITTATQRWVYDFDADGRLTQQHREALDSTERHTTTFAWTRDDLPQTATDPAQKRQEWQYNLHGEVSVAVNAKGDRVTYGYDRQGRLRTVTDAQNRVTTYGWNARGELESETRPGGEQRQWRYEANGNLRQAIDAKGQVTVYTYDKDNRLRDTRYYAHAEAETPVRHVVTTWDERDLLKTETQGSWQRERTYDALGRIRSETTHFGPFSKTWSVTYTHNQRLKTLTDPEGRVITYDYDKANRLYKITIPGEGAIIVTSWADTTPLTWTYPGGHQRTDRLDGMGRRVSQQFVDIAQTEKLLQGLQWDNTDHLKELVTPKGKTTYQYDAIYQLTSVTGLSGTFASDYDTVNNRLSPADAEAVLWAYSEDHGLLASPGASYTRDANGSRLTKTDAKGTLTYEWDIAGRLAAVKQGNTVIARYDYDPSGRRYRKIVNGETTYYLYGESGLMGEYDASGNLKRGYHYHPEQPWGTAPLWQTQNGTFHYLLYSPSLLPVLAFTKTGKVTWEGQFTAFGALLSDKSAGTSVDLRFPGQLHDEETQLHYNGFRYYDPSVGRYLRRDPLGLFDGPNAYVYTGNDPVNMFDPYGLCKCKLPDSKKFLDNYPDYWEFNAAEVWDLIGGSLGDSYGEKREGGPADSCAARGSYALNKSGALISPADGTNLIFGGENNGERYIISAKKLNKYLKDNYGKPDRQVSSVSDFLSLWWDLEGGQIALVSSKHHFGVFKTTYTDKYVLYRGGDVWILPNGDCSCK